MTDARRTGVVARLVLLLLAVLVVGVYHLAQLLLKAVLYMEWTILHHLSGFVKPVLLAYPVEVKKEGF